MCVGVDGPGKPKKEPWVYRDEDYDSDDPYESDKKNWG